MSNDYVAFFNVLSKMVQFCGHVTGAWAMLDGCCEFYSARVVLEYGAAHSCTFLNNQETICVELLQQAHNWNGLAK